MNKKRIFESEEELYQYDIQEEKVDIEELLHKNKEELSQDIQSENKQIVEYLTNLEQVMENKSNVNTNMILKSISKIITFVKQDKSVTQQEIDTTIIENLLTEIKNKKPFVVENKEILIPEVYDLSEKTLAVFDKLLEKNKAVAISNNSGKVIDTSGDTINPSTKEEQVNIISKLQEIADNTDTLELNAENINLNTDELESKLDTIANNQLPDNHKVTVDNQLTGYSTDTKQDDIITSLGELKTSNDKLKQDFSVRNKEEATDYKYVGFEILSSGDWKIMRIDLNSNEMETLYAIGTTDYKTNWTNRATLTYN